MFKFCNLYSGSSGNCSFIETENTKILIDFGMSCKKTNEALNTLGLSLSDINAILISHEHSDHIKGLTTFCKHYNIPIYSSKKTFDKLKGLSNKTFNINENFEINDLIIKAFDVPHDAIETCAFNIIKDKKKISIATDIGKVQNSIIENLTGSNFVLLEANYDKNLIKFSNYPYLLKKRIIGEYGHLSNDDSSMIINTIGKARFY